MIRVEISEDAQADLNEGFLFKRRRSRAWAITSYGNNSEIGSEPSCRIGCRVRALVWTPQLLARRRSARPLNHLRDLKRGRPNVGKRQAGRVDGLARPPLKAPWRS
jgi:hypothetical protein